MKYKQITSASLIAGVALALVSCTKEPLNNLTEEETRIYVTNHDSTVDFGSFQTFSVSDSAVVLDNGTAYKELTPVDQAYIDAVKKYMQQQGYTEVGRENTPDIGIDVNRIYNTSTGYFGYNDYWNYYGGYWDPFYWGYGGYGYYIPPTYGIYQVTEGAMSVDMLDLKNAPSKNKIDVIWNGLIRGEGIFSTTTADGSVKALFDQSPYLQTN